MEPSSLGTYAWRAKADKTFKPAINSLSDLASAHGRCAQWTIGNTQVAMILFITLPNCDGISSTVAPALSSALRLDM